MARDGSINMALGMRLRFARHCSVRYIHYLQGQSRFRSFQSDAYRSLLLPLVGYSYKRHLVRKEVIIEDPRHGHCTGLVRCICVKTGHMNQRKQLLRAPNYVQTFFRYEQDEAAKQIRDRIESLVEELSNSRDSKVLALLNEFPSIYAAAHTSPFHSHRANVLAGIFFPLGLILGSAFGGSACACCAICASPFAPVTS